LRVPDGSRGPVARMPSPPALETAATIFGTLIQLMPDRRMGYLIPNSSVILVFTYELLRLSLFSKRGKRGDFCLSIKKTGGIWRDPPAFKTF
jgi:hypothetical protein